jgi:hypothetical protein
VSTQLNLTCIEIAAITLYFKYIDLCVCWGRGCCEWLGEQEHIEDMVVTTGMIEAKFDEQNVKFVTEYI